MYTFWLTKITMFVTHIVFLGCLRLMYLTSTLIYKEQLSWSYISVNLPYERAVVVDQCDDYKCNGLTYEIKIF